MRMHVLIGLPVALTTCIVGPLVCVNVDHRVLQDHCIGSNETLFEEKLEGVYPPYYEGVADNVFIRDPRNPAKYLEGEVCDELKVLLNATRCV